MTCQCEELSAVYRGLRVNRIEELATQLEQVEIDAMNWRIRYRCRDCGQEWLEAWEPTGHGEIPVVCKVK